MNHPSNPIRAGESLPVPPTHIPTWRPPEDIPQREDYVPPEVPSYRDFEGVTLNVKDALEIHRFLEVNAVYQETKAMADRLRGIIEGKI